MKNTLSLFLIIFILLVLQCGKDETEDTETGVTKLPVISEITFGSGWRNIDSSITNIDTIFSPFDTVYYEVIFDTVLVNNFMVKKVWRRDDILLFSSVVLVPGGTKRICGEIRRYDGQNLETGTYELSILYFKSDIADYDSAEYDSGVNRNFDIQ